ncbi:MAG: hypothetical protein AAFV53_30465 [Myxococcota bacterium]
MSFAELLSAVPSLSHQEKIELMRVLVEEMACEAQPSARTLTHTVWSPHESFSTADTLLHLLQTDE